MSILKGQAIEHWKRVRPKMYRALLESGELEAAAQHAADLTENAMADMISKGAAPDQAREMFLQEWIFLPSEEDMPNLGESVED